MGFKLRIEININQCMTHIKQGLNRKFLRWTSEGDSNQNYLSQKSVHHYRVYPL
jgi:hypothetical protein